MKKPSRDQVLEILRLAQQSANRVMAVRIALVAAIAESGRPVDPILERIDRILAAINKQHPDLANALAEHVAELKELIRDPA